jgi:hypothetical protein
MSKLNDVWQIIKFLAVYRTVQVYFYDFRTAIGPSMVPTIREGN